jgi:2-C-methyl-D-erythritol 2,4-cyclodiphosphate synthase
MGQEAGVSLVKKMRVGQGFDAHRFSEGRDLVLGGVHIPHSKGLAGHSDADVLIHAMVDALLGAMGETDIGSHFPPGDPTTEGIDSSKILLYTLSLLKDKGFGICNFDTTIICEEPRLGSQIQAIRSNLSRILEIEDSQVSVKATTTETMGFTGRKEGIAAMAIVMIERIKKI